VTPLQNRVTPFGEIVASTARGGLMGNRGILHDDRKQLGAARWRSKAWISCVLEWKGSQRTVMSPGSYTELFFLDEATSCAAGHRPCAQCRRRDYNRFVAAWRQAEDIGEGTPVTASVIDARLHTERVAPRTRGKITFTAPLGNLPDGNFRMRRHRRCWCWATLCCRGRPKAMALRSESHSGRPAC
jgi:hypothetical protein